MSDAEAQEPTTEDQAAVGFAMLMADVHTAVAAAGEEIAALAQLVQAGIGNPPVLSPQPVPAPRHALRQPPERGGSPAPQPRPPAPVIAVAPAPARSLPAPGEMSAPVRHPPLLARDGAEPEARQPAPAVAAVSVPPARPAPLVRIMRAEAAPLAAVQFRAAPSLRARLDEPLAAPAPIAAPFGDPAVPDAAAPVFAVASAPVTANSPPQSLAPKWPVPAAASVTAQPSAGVSAGAPVSRPGEPQAHPDGSGLALHGDVFLDGLRVGHWMSESLARAASGPARGATGHDSLMGPRWPGALQGR